MVFIAGVGRSGSTLLERVLGELPGVCSVGEVVHLWERGVRNNERCGCGAAFHDCPFWRRVGEVAFGGWANADPDRVHELQRTVDDVRYVPRLVVSRVGGEFRRALEEYNAYYERLYAAVRQVSGCHVVIDSSKRTSLAYCLRRSPRLRLRVLHVVRDSRAVAYAWTKTVRRPEVVDADSYMPRFSPAYLALLWNGHNALLQALRWLGTPRRLVRYERFMAAPEAVLADVAHFAELSIDETALSFLDDGHVRLSATHTVAGNPMRFTTGRVELRRDDEWRRSFPEGQRRVVSALTFPVGACYGYGVPRPRPAAERMSRASAE
ncbi:MAG: sulfotransferase [Streptosporangiales bacterium]|nr:sulfotransferase [Streptosporangiales bacterium]